MEWEPSTDQSAQGNANRPRVLPRFSFWLGKPVGWSDLPLSFRIVNNQIVLVDHFWSKRETKFFTNSPTVGSGNGFDLFSVVTHQTAGESLVLMGNVDGISCPKPTTTPCGS